MKKIVLLMLVGVMLLTSCVSTSVDSNKSGSRTSSSKVDSRLQTVVNAMKSAAPEKGDVWMMDVNESIENTYTASPFYAASIFMMLDERFNFSGIMTDSQKIAFTRALVLNLEDVKESKDVRAVVLGKYFSDSSELDNLYIIISKVHLKPGVVPNADYAYQFVTNAVLTRSKDTGEVKAMCTGNVVNTNFNYNFLAVPFGNGMLVTAGNLNLNKQNYSAEMSLLDKGNLMDTFAKDEIAENDILIENIYNEINNTKDSGDTDKIVKYFLAPLNFGLYLVKQGKINEAEKLWKNIKLSKIPGETESQKNTLDSMKTVFERDIPNYLLISSEF